MQQMLPKNVNEAAAEPGPDAAVELKAVVDDADAVAVTAVAVVHAMAGDTMQQKLPKNERRRAAAEAKLAARIAQAGQRITTLDVEQERAERDVRILSEKLAATLMSRAELEARRRR